MSVEIVLPDRTKTLKHIDECYQVHLRNQVLVAVMRSFDRFNHEWLDEGHMKAIQDADKDAMGLDKVQGIWGRIDFSNGKTVDLKALRSETLHIVRDGFFGKINGSR